MNEIRFLRNEACPKCLRLGRDRHRDNLGRWEDGHAYCWSCGYWEPSHSSYRIAQLGQQLPKVEEQSSIALPYDCDSYIPAACRIWLGKYDISEYEIVGNRLMWSESKKYLLFPYFDVYHNLMGWQGRYFGDNVKHPKWFSRGDMKKLYYCLPKHPSYDILVLVEDIVSAIKVSRVVPSMPLFGSKIGLERLIRLSKLTKEVRIWLDPDKRKESLRESIMASKLGLPSKVIFSEADPKEYDEESIQKYVQSV